jgi:type IV secretion system protein VirD4
MRWTRLLIFFLLLALLGWLCWWLFPAVQPVLAHPPKSGALHSMILTFFSSSYSHQRPTDLQHPGIWVLLALMATMLVVAQVDMRLQKQGTFGTAGPATRRQARLFRQRSSKSGLVVRTLVHTPMVLVALAARAPQQARKQTSAASQFVLGRYQGRMIALSEQQQEEHLFGASPTGGGKSSQFVIPNLLREDGNRSLFIPDLKDELYDITAGALAQHHQIWRFAPSQPDRSHGYNPLAHIKNAMDANILADCWVMNTGKSHEAFWLNSAKFLISATALHLRATEPNAPFCRLADFITQHTFKELQAILPKSPSHEARRKAATFLDYMSQNERLVGSIMTDIVGRFQLFDSDDVRTATATNDLDFEQMAETPTALYLSIPYTEVDLYSPLLACLTTQMFRAWSERANRARTRTLPRGIACYLDEFANLGYIPGYPRFVSIARYLRVSLLMVTQDFDQLDELYGKSGATTIQSNAKTHLLLPGAGDRECEFYSRRIGDTTVRTWTRTSRGTSWFGTDDTWTQGEARRRLFTPDELRTLKPHSMLVLRADLGPMIVKSTPYYRDRSVAHLANLPYPVTPMTQGPLAPASGPPPQTPPPAAPVVDADQDDPPTPARQTPPPDIQQHFLDEE